MIERIFDKSVLRKIMAIGIYGFYAVALFKPDWLNFFSINDLPEFAQRFIGCLLGVALWAGVIGMSFAFIVGVLGIVISAMNKWLLEGKIELRYRMLFSFGVSIVLTYIFLLNVLKSQAL